jgi:hypothetical protein
MTDRKLPVRIQHQRKLREDYLIAYLRPNIPVI